MSWSLVHHFLEHSAARWPERTFLANVDPVASYAQVNAASNQMARLFRAHGVERGDRVAIVAHNGPSYVASYYGALKAGAVAVPMHTAIDPTTLTETLGDAGAKVLVAGPGLERLIMNAGRRLSSLALLVHAPSNLAIGATTGAPTAPLDRAGELDATNLDLPIDPSDLAAIIYTSGSTGRPRGAMLSHRNLVANARSILAYSGLAEDDRVLLVLPMPYVFGKSLLNTCAAAGACVVIENRFQYPNVALDTLERERCTGMAGVPSTYAILMNRSNFAERKLPDLRWMSQAGGGMNPTLTRRVLEALGPSRKLHVMYGATEASARLSHLPPEELPGAIGSIGRAIPGVELTVRRDDGSPCEVDETGELFARGDNIMRGYWNDPDETLRVLGPHGYATGDLARRDARGLLWLVGRKKDMLKVGGHRVAAKEIEDTILEHPAIHEVAVIGVPDELLGDRLIAMVVARPGATVTAQELGAFLKQRVAAYKIPGDIEVRGELPKNAAGKIAKEVLRHEVAGRGG